MWIIIGAIVVVGILWFLSSGVTVSTVTTTGTGTGTATGTGTKTGSGSGTGSNPVVKKPWSSLKEGAPMRCSANELRKSDGSIYRYVGNDTARWYPSPAIASSWDANWEKYDSIDCANMNLGPEMTYNMTDKTIGAPIRCTANELRGVDGSIYRYTGDNTLRHYPSPAIASSWDSNWGNYSNIDCANLKLGPQMEPR